MGEDIKPINPYQIQVYLHLTDEGENELLKIDPVQRNDWKFHNREDGKWVEMSMIDSYRNLAKLMNSCVKYFVGGNIHFELPD